jgi:hypothetical protein
MKVRTFQAGDEAAQVAIYNEAAAQLPGFKPATVHEVQRRTAARDFDPSTRFYALAGDTPVAYCQFHASGRVSYPWCRPGHEACAAPLFERAVGEMKAREIPLAFAAYRGDWPAVGDFFASHGFVRAREMINYKQEVLNLPTISFRASSPVAPLRKEDVPALFQLAPEALRVCTPARLEEHLFKNPYFSPASVFVVRGKTEAEPVAAGTLITDPTYAEVEAIDPRMPCFRLGAFGTEFMQTKRVKGLFSLLARPDTNFFSLAYDVLNYAVSNVQDHDDIGTLAAQAPSDVPHLVKFYDKSFMRQGAFPVYERRL